MTIAIRIAAAAAILALALPLGGCAGFLQSVYDEAASDACSDAGASHDRCQDSVDRNSREHSNW